MFQHLLNQIQIKFLIKANGPLLIKASDEGGGMDIMRFVRTWRNGRQEVYLPGSSLKGAFRAHAERLARTLQSDSVCNPFNQDLRFKNSHDAKRRNPSKHGVPCCYDAIRGVRRDKKSNLMPEEFKVICPACQLFGSLLSAGHVSLNDAYLADDNKMPDLEIRDGVGIDRFSGGAVNGAKFMFEAMTHGGFQASLVAQNLAWWQLAWLGLVLRDLQEGLLPIGMGNARGLGQVKASLQDMQIDILSPHPIKADAPLPCLVSQKAACADYGFALEKDVVLPEGVKPESVGLRQRLLFDGLQTKAFLDSIHPRFAARITSANHQHMQQWRHKHNLTKGLEAVS